MKMTEDVEIKMAKKSWKLLNDCVIAVVEGRVEEFVHFCTWGSLPGYRSCLQVW